MTTVRISVDVAATPEAVWRVVGDPRNLPHWDRHIEAVEGIPPDGIGAGTEYTTVMRLMGVRARVRARVEEWDPPRRSVIHLSGILDATVTTTVEPLGGGSRLQHEVAYGFRGGPLGRFAARSLQLVGGAHLALRHGTLSQKRQIEGGGS